MNKRKDKSKHKGEYSREYRPLYKHSTLVRFAGLGAGIACGAIVAALFVPPIRDRVFATRLWPWALPWDTNIDELAMLKSLALPGDVLVESNLHGWQWVALSLFATQTSWVHAAIVDHDYSLITVHGKATKLDWSIYQQWGSTRLALIRPPYTGSDQIDDVLAYASSKLGTGYDPSFREHAGSCNGLVGSALTEAGVPVKMRRCYGRDIYAADSFFAIPGAEVVWHSDSGRTKSAVNAQP
jgi:hypothetical protein